MSDAVNCILVTEGTGAERGGGEAAPGAGGQGGASGKSCRWREQPCRETGAGGQGRGSGAAADNVWPDRSRVRPQVEVRLVEAVKGRLWGGWEEGLGPCLVKDAVS